MVLAATTLAFATLHLAPGDAATALGKDVPVEVREQLRVQYALDQPLVVQYWRWLVNTLSGDLGMSSSKARPVVDAVGDALRATLWLVIPGFTLALAVGVLIGRWQALNAGRLRERAAGTVLLAVYSLPEFWFGLSLLLFFAHRWQLLPTGGMVGDFADHLPFIDRVKDRFAHLVLPVAALAVTGVAAFARYQRASLLQVLDMPFVRTATGAGLPRRRVLWGAWRASILPVVTVAGFTLPAWIAGVVFVESVFSWPGMGRLLVQAVAARDLRLVCGAVIVGSAVTATFAALADLLRGVVDPRLVDAADA